MANQIEALKAQAAKYFEANPTAQVVYGTADGNLFALKNKRDAEEHARRNKLELHEFTKSQEPKAESQEPNGKQEESTAQAVADAVEEVAAIIDPEKKEAKPSSKKSAAKPAGK